MTMDKKQSQEKIRATFESPFDKDRFVSFIQDLLNYIDGSKAFHARGDVKEMFKHIIRTYERLGTYTDPDGEKVDIIIAYLQKGHSLDHARVTQRNFAAKYLSDRGEKDAGLFAFVSPEEDDWRFSLVKLDYRFEEGEAGKVKVKVKEDFTPARRWSFLVGKNEKSHTAQSRLAPILADDEHNPALKELEEAFNIEKVTKEFFEKYRELFLLTKKELDDVVSKNSKVKADFEAKGINTVDFAKKLLGQIVFLYFLQKKGWFGVERDKAWGTGSKKFLRDLFDGRIIQYKNFFNDVLEPLFYDALARDRTDVDHFNPLFKCKIPFLNGGLFDPINDYDWVHTDIRLSNELFSNREKTLEGDTGTGILDIFDRYNFTVKEDEPLEKEVAVDPEMLGKVFENLLEVKDRKSKGTYYTPREIVHYMCQESLISYLEIGLEGRANREDIETLIKYGETVVEHDSHVSGSGRETNTYYFKLPQTIRDNAKLIDDKLSTVRVCDPAVGSGAFLVGMMNEIVRTKNVLTSYLNGESGRSIYDFKRHAIQNCLYGVDIDPGAVEIAKLRLWLSLVVEEEDIQTIKPLPNLDYKIMQGNSLLEEYEGIKLIDERFFQKPIDLTKEFETIRAKQSALQKEYFELHSKNRLTPVKKFELQRRLGELDKQLKGHNNSSTPDQGKLGIFKPSESQQKAERLLKLQYAFFETAQKGEKDKIKMQIERLSWELIEVTLQEKEQREKVKELTRFRTVNVKPFFLWKLHFADVFRENEGFDIVIANPPYIVLPVNYFKDFFWTKGNSNTYVAFLEIAHRLINRTGVISYIIPTTWMAGNNFSEFRRYLIDHKSIQEIVQLPYDIFQAYVDNVILIITGERVDNLFINTFKFNIRDTVRRNISYERFAYDDWSTDEEHTIFLNKNLISLLRKYKKVYSLRLGEIAQVQRGTLPPKKSELYPPNFDDSRKKLIDWFSGQIHRYRFENYSFHKVEYSRLRENKPLELFEKPKIIGRQLISRQFRLQFTYLDTPCAFKKNLYAIYDLDQEFHHYYVMAVLNSAFYSFIQVNLNTSGQRDDFPAFSLQDYRNFLIPNLSLEKQNPFISLVEKILELTCRSDYNYDGASVQAVRAIDSKIDEMIYKLYELTPEEIAIVEGESIDFNNKQ
jgi:type I restriction-modification system DNA methylase subunit